MAQSDIKIISILQNKGDKLSKDDLFEINSLLTQGDVETAFERHGWVYESIMLTVSDPLYKGDINLSDLEDDD